jgi:ribosomal protein S18 acetylase RimI-like enzyme
VTLRARDAVAADYLGFVGLWRELELGAVPPSEAHWIARMLPSTIFIAAAHELVAYAMVFPYGARGDVRQIAVAPGWRRRGVGRRLMSAVAARLRAAGCRDWRLEVRADNAAAIGLYEAAGMRVQREIDVVTIARAALASLAERTDRFTAAIVPPEDDAALEAHYDLGAGELAGWRTLRTRTPLWAVREAGELAGFARYCAIHEPDCALLFPFRARDAAAAAHLAQAAMIAPLPARLELCVVDAPVAVALIDAGGKLAERHLEMGGEL